MTGIFVYQSYYIALFHMAALFLLIFLNVVIWLRTAKSPLLCSFFVLQGILALWIVSKILKTFAPNTDLKFFFVTCQYAGVCFLGTAFVIFAHIFAYGVKPVNKIMLPLILISALCFITVLTNPLHYLFYSHFDFWGDSFGPLFYLQQGFHYSLIVTGVIICSRKLFNRLSSKRIHTILISAAIAIPMIANVLYVFRYFKRIFGFSPPFDITPMSASASLIILAFATFKLKLFDNLKIVRRAALSNIPEGILLVAGGRAGGFNNTFIRMAAEGKLIPAGKGSIISTIGDACYALNIGLSFSFDSSKAAAFTYETEAGDYTRLLSRPITCKAFNGAFIRVIDVTANQHILNELQAKNDELQSMYQHLTHRADIKRKLVVTRTRNYAAQEVHDILGHSIMLAVSLLEIARLSDDPFPGMEYIIRAKDILTGSIKEIRSVSPAANTPNSTGKSILKRLEDLADRFRTDIFEVGISCSNLARGLTAPVEDTVFKLCREAITNALRHGKASRADIILRSRKGMLELFIIDNGTGCGAVQKGMGLMGMEERVSLLRGTFTCHSLHGRGFCVHAVIPDR